MMIPYFCVTSDNEDTLPSWRGYLEEGVVLPVAGEALEVPGQDAVGGIGGTALGAWGQLPAVVDEAVEGFAADGALVFQGFLVFRRIL